MRSVVQRVTSAQVSTMTETGEEYRAEIGAGYLILLGIRSDDSNLDVGYLADKIANLRVFEDDAGKLNRSILDVGGSALIVSNFTLYGDCRKGRRPSFTEAASGPTAERLYRVFGAVLESRGVRAEYGVFGADMQVSLVNDGPVTILLDSRKQF